MYISQERYDQIIKEGKTPGSFYAVKRGRKPGLYSSWNECKKQVQGYTNATYQCFDNKQDAEKYLESEDIVSLEDIDMNKIDTYAFVDGSINPKEKIYGYGGFLVHKTVDKNGKENITKFIISGYDNDPEMFKMRNISGELLGCKAAIELALKKKYKNLTIFYDYLGIENFAKGLWKRSKKFTEEYYEYYQSIKDKIDITFIKVKGHTGLEGNEDADKLAKKAVGVLKSKNTNSEETGFLVKDFKDVFDAMDKMIDAMFSDVSFETLVNDEGTTKMTTLINMTHNYTKEDA